MVERRRRGLIQREETDGQTVGSFAETWIQKGRGEDGLSFGQSTEI